MADDGSSEYPFFIYNHEILKKEADDPNDAIIYFYPPRVSADDRVKLCGQLMGLVRFYVDFTGAPPIVYHLKHSQYVMLHHGEYSLALGGDPELPVGVLRRQLDFIYRLFTFYHRSMEEVKRLCSAQNADFHEYLGLIWDTYIPYLRYYGDDFSAAMQPIQSLYLTKGESPLFLKAVHLLEMCQRVPGVMAGCLLVRNKVLCTQLTPDFTARLSLIRPHQAHLPCRAVKTDFTLPMGVRLLSIYITEEEFSSLNPSQSEWPTSKHHMDSRFYPATKPALSSDTIVDNEQTEDGTQKNTSQSLSDLESHVCAEYTQATQLVLVKHICAKDTSQESVGSNLTSLTENVLSNQNRVEHLCGEEKPEVTEETSNSESLKSTEIEDPLKDENPSEVSRNIDFIDQSATSAQQETKVEDTSHIEGLKSSATADEPNDENPSEVSKQNYIIGSSGSSTACAEQEIKVQEKTQTDSLKSPEIEYQPNEETPSEDFRTNDNSIDSSFTSIACLELQTNDQEKCINDNVLSKQNRVDRLCGEEKTEVKEMSKSEGLTSTENEDRLKDENPSGVSGNNDFINNRSATSAQQETKVDDIFHIEGLKSPAIADKPNDENPSGISKNNDIIDSFASLTAYSEQEIKVQEKTQIDGLEAPEIEYQPNDETPSEESRTNDNIIDSSSTSIACLEAQINDQEKGINENVLSNQNRLEHLCSEEKPEVKEETSNSEGLKSTEIEDPLKDENPSEVSRNIDFIDQSATSAQQETKVEDTSHIEGLKSSATADEPNDGNPSEVSKQNDIIGSSGSSTACAEQDIKVQEKTQTDSLKSPEIEYQPNDETPSEDFRTNDNIIDSSSTSIACLEAKTYNQEKCINEKQPSIVDIAAHVCDSIIRGALEEYKKLKNQSDSSSVTAQQNIVSQEVGSSELNSVAIDCEFGAKKPKTSDTDNPKQSGENEYMNKGISTSENVGNNNSAAETGNHPDIDSHLTNVVGVINKDADGDRSESGSEIDHERTKATWQQEDERIPTSETENVENSSHLEELVKKGDCKGESEPKTMTETDHILTKDTSIDHKTERIPTSEAGTSDNLENTISAVVSANQPCISSPPSNLEEFLKTESVDCEDVSEPKTMTKKVHIPTEDTSKKEAELIPTTDNKESHKSDTENEDTFIADSNMDETEPVKKSAKNVVLNRSMPSADRLKRQKIVPMVPLVPPTAKELFMAVKAASQTALRNYESRATGSVPASPELPPKWDGIDNGGQKRNSVEHGGPQLSKSESVPNYMHSPRRISLNVNAQTSQSGTEEISSDEARKVNKPEGSSVSQSGISPSTSSSESVRKQPTSSASLVTEEPVYKQGDFRKSRTEESPDGMEEMDLYIQGNADLLLILIMENGCGQYKSTIQSLWKGALPQLGEMDLFIKQKAIKGNPPKRNKDLEYDYLIYNSVQQTLKGNMLRPVSSTEHAFVKTAIELHGEFSSRENLSDMIIRSDQSYVFGHRAGNQETFFQMQNSARFSTGLPNEHDVNIVADDTGYKKLRFREDSLIV